jgi:glycosyltransferase involved in cell wall biosynthesis
VENVLIDHHHGELTVSLELLFGRRLGYRVFYPIGLEWYEKGYWKVFPHPDTARQYLAMSQADLSVYSRQTVLTTIGEEPVEQEFHYCFNPCKDAYQKTITLQCFLEQPIKIIVTSIPEHVPCFQELIEKYKPGAKLIFQMGNMYPYFKFQGVRNVLNSTSRRVPFYIHSVNYSQEFDLDLFSFQRPFFQKNIVNLEHYMSNPFYFREVQESLPEFSFLSYGAGNPLGPISKTAEVARVIGQADFIWHLKKGGDGYGHVVHNAAACGRPLIISKKTYQKLRFGKFIEDGKTCVCVDGHDAKTLAKKIRYYSEPSKLLKMSRRLYERFRNLVNFNQDEKKIRHFLERLR